MIPQLQIILRVEYKNVVLLSLEMCRITIASDHLAAMDIGGAVVESALIV